MKHDLQNNFLPKISCVVPALNESRNLQVLLPILGSILSSQEATWEVIVVDDGSTDATLEIMALWCTKPGYRYIQLTRNFGKEAALSAGLAATRGEAVICLDADLQHPPSLIPEMLDRWRKGADSVIAVRADRKDESPIKRFGASLLYFILARGNKIHIPPDASDFRLMSRKVVAALLQLPERTRFMKGLYAWVGFQSELIEYVPPARQYGTSHFNFFKLVQFAVDGITAFSTWPLRLISEVGALVAMASFAYGSYLVLKHLVVGNNVSGWTTIITAMLFLSGVNLFGLGVLGAYVARIFDEVKMRPMYLIKNDTGFSLHLSTFAEAEK